MFSPISGSGTYAAGSVQCSGNGQVPYPLAGRGKIILRSNVHSFTVNIDTTIAVKPARFIKKRRCCETGVRRRKHYDSPSVCPMIGLGPASLAKAWAVSDRKQQNEKVHGLRTNVLSGSWNYPNIEKSINSCFREVVYARRSRPRFKYPSTAHFAETRN